jgi:ABC-type multidrug transport system permease subunit
MRSLCRAAPDRATHPTTYVLESMRGLLIGGWNPGQLASGFAVIGGLCIAATLWATRVARRTTSRR